MGHLSRRIAAALTSLLVVASLAAEDRLAVLEFFGRFDCANCQEAGAAISTLQAEFAGRAVLLEYDYYTFSESPRVARFWAAASDVVFLPLVMVGSGSRTTSGARSIGVYRSMVDYELARPPEAAVSAYSRRMGDALRVYVRIENTGNEDLTAADEPTLWVIVWENRPIGVTRTWVRAAGSRALPTRFPSGTAVDMVFDTPPLPGADWRTVQSLALVERATGEINNDPDLRLYDALQAAQARPADLTATPDRVVLDPGRRAASLALDGPHVLEWTASTDAAWLRVDPASGTLPGSPTVSLVPGLQPPGAAAGTVRIDAAGDGMTFTTLVPVQKVVTTPRPAGLRARPNGG